MCNPKWHASVPADLTFTAMTQLLAFVLQVLNQSSGHGTQCDSLLVHVLFEAGRHGETLPG